jgi:hypothetical protein
MLKVRVKCVFHAAFESCLFVMRLNGGLIVGSGSERSAVAGVCVMTRPGN